MSNGETFYIVEDCGSGTFRKNIHKYAPNFHRFETEDGQELYLNLGVKFTCETCTKLPECEFSLGKDDTCYRYERKK